MTRQQGVLLVDDDAALRAALRKLLVNGGFCVAEAGSLAEVDRRISEGPAFSAVILEVVLPDGDGRDLCAQLRARGFQQPILLLTQLTNESDLVRGLDAGANDYIRKSVGDPELLARLRAHLRIANASGSGDFAVGPFVFRQGVQELQYPDGRTFDRLPNKEAAILKLLVQASPAPVQRSTILDQVWRNRTPVNWHTLATHISRLRQKLEPNPLHPSVIVRDRDAYVFDPRALNDAHDQVGAERGRRGCASGLSYRRGRLLTFPPFRNNVVAVFGAMSGLLGVMAQGFGWS